MPTFEDAAYDVHEMSLHRWRSEKNAWQWLSSVERHAFPLLGHKRIDDIDRGDVLRVLTPIWTAKPEQARRVRRRLKAIFRWAQAHDYIAVNPAGEVIDGALVPQPAVKEHRALSYEDVPAALKTIETSSASLPSRLCLRFLVLIR